MSCACVAVSLVFKLSIGRKYISEMRAAWGDGDDPPAKDTPQHARLLECVASFRQMLAVFLAEHTDTSRWAPLVEWDSTVHG